MPEPIPIVKVINQPTFLEIALAVAVGVVVGGAFIVYIASVFV